MVEMRQRDSIPVAVIRRQARAAELSRVVPECCGLVWNAVRAQQAKAGRHVAIYWDATIRLEVGVELLGPFVEQGDEAEPDDGEKVHDQVHDHLLKARISPEGYNVVMQGDVTRIIEVSDFERRKIIDEIAGTASSTKRPIRRSPSWISSGTGSTG